MVYVKDLLKLACFRTFDLICGQSGLNRQVSWPNIAQTPSIREWLVGGDVILMTGVGLQITEDFLNSIIEQAAEGRAACLIILINKEHIRKIPEGTREWADRLGLPVFAAPWETKLSILIRDISNVVFTDQHKEQLMNEFLEDILTGKTDFHSEEAKERLRKYGLYKPHAAAVVRFAGISRRNIQEEAPLYDSRICAAANLLAKGQFETCHYLSKRNEIIFLFAPDEKDSEKILQSFQKIAHSLEKQFPEERFNIGIGGVYGSPEEISRSFMQARKALAFSAREKVVSFEKMGIFQLLSEIPDQEKVRQYVRKRIGALLDYDRMHNQELMHTLEAYLYMNGNLVHTAEELYIHRNTLLRRLEKIEGLLNVSLKDADTRNTLYNCITMWRFLSA